MSGVLTPRRGRVLHSATSGPVGAPGGAVARPGARKLPLLILLGTLPLFGQMFHYMVDVPPAYYLSKAWPFLTLPLALHALAQLRLPHKPTLVLMLAYCLGLTPILSMIHLGNGLFDALATTVKAWPFTYYFSLAGMLALLRPAAVDARRAVIVLGAATFAAMLALWIVVPASAYSVDPTQSKLLMYDYERGYRIYMPMVFGVLLLFYLARRFCDRLELWTLPFLFGGFAMMVLIYKQRLAIASVAAVIGWIVVSSARGWWRAAVVSLGALVGLAGGGVVVMRMAEQADRMLGASLSIRQNSIALALGYMDVSPLRWLFGIGSITRFSQVTMADIFGNANFYLADIGWIGIAFEYGVIGALLILGVYLAALATAWKGRRAADPLDRALADYVLYLLLTSLVYSAVFVPGEVVMVMALSVYLRSADAGPPRVSS